MSHARSSERSASPKARSPARIKTVVWLFTVGLPMLVAVLVYYAEPPIDLTMPVSWLAAGVWMALAVAMFVSVGRAKTASGRRIPQLVLVALMLGLVALVVSSSGFATAANTLAAGFWGLFVGSALYFGYLFSYRRKFLYCERCAQHRWMLRTPRGFECLNCKTVRNRSGGLGGGKAKG